MAEEAQKILIGRPERLYREFKDANCALVDPSYTSVSVYNPEGEFVSSGAATKESTGVYYYSVSLSTAATTQEGTYQAYWEGNISGNLVTMDLPQYFYAHLVPWQITKVDDVINSVRRAIGDTDPNRYRISTIDMYYYLQDAVDEVQSFYDFGYEMTITATAYSWNKTLYSTPFVLFKLRAMILVLESTLNDNLYDGGSVQVGDIKIDVTSILRMRMDNLRRLKEQYDDFMYEIKMNGISGHIIDTYATGLINNTAYNDYLIYE